MSEFFDDEVFDRVEDRECEVLRMWLVSDDLLTVPYVVARSLGSEEEALLAG